MKESARSVKVSVITSLYRCENFLEEYLDCVLKIENLEECEFILVHNDPTEKELEIIEAYKNGPINIVHLGVEREGLYCSWNRAIKIARGKYITVWNVDDIRFTNSISMQARALDENPAAALAYGDIYGSNEYGELGKRLYQFPEWEGNKTEFYRSYLISCFQMWRSSIHSKVGYYDEQFRCVADFDFQIRTALHFPMIKVKEPLGIYLEDQPHKISNNSAQVLENNIVYLRYGVYEKIQLQVLQRSVATYKRDQFLFYGNWSKNYERSPFTIFYHFQGLCISAAKMPVYMLKTYAHKFFQ
jgi:glycosyltransferase involved in cell wall biosynthesis